MATSNTYNPLPGRSRKALPSTGSVGDVAAACPHAVYTDNPEFLSGASDQVRYVYQQLGGDYLDIELTAGQVYTAYQDAALAWSRIVNLHQAKNVLSSLLGKSTGTFDHEGQLLSGNTIPDNIALRYPRFSLEAERNVAQGIGAVANHGSQFGQRLYSASIPVETGRQDYNIREHIRAKMLATPELSGSADKVVDIKKIFYRHAGSIWRFFGYYGGLNVVGNLSTYGQYADDSTFEIVPVWQNKLQAMAYKDSLWTRTSHYSYEVHGDWIRVHPIPGANFGTRYLWAYFSVPSDPWESDSQYVSGSYIGEFDDGTLGINNIGTIPFANIPYDNSNSIGKDWIRRYALAICKTMLGYTRGKFQSVPIPKENVTLNYSQLHQDGQREKKELEDELVQILKETSYAQLARENQERVEATKETLRNVPLFIRWTSGDGQG